MRFIAPQCNKSHLDMANRYTQRRFRGPTYCKKLLVLQPCPPKMPQRFNREEVCG